MKKRIIRYVKHLLGTLAFLLVAGLIILLSVNGSLEYGNNPLNIHLDQEGPYVFQENDSTWNSFYIRGNKNDGFYLDQKPFSKKEAFTARCHFPLDGSYFDFAIQPQIHSPRSVYDDEQPILALSDLESGYSTFRDFLIANKVINDNLDWTFGKGHLVLVGDFVDRGFSTTQVLWFIYKLEQDAKKHGGHVHFILGNHELYNLQGKYQSASYKYYGVASILGKQHHDLYSERSFLGKWMSSKNTLERINGVLFAHGGIHPDFAKYNITIDQVNTINRNNYRKPYFPKPTKTIDQLILSNTDGICWYRGYFKEDLSQEDVEKSIDKFGASAIVVGHTIHRKVKQFYKGKVYAIDVKHPKDYNKNWPNKKSEGLLIIGDTYYRVLANGEKIEL